MTASSPPAIAVDIDHVSKVFGSGSNAVRALDAASLAIQENEFFTLLGPSGCGKTTLLRLIAGFDHPTEGRIRLHGEDIAHLPPFKRPVNTVFQNYALFPHMTVAQNIGFGLEMLGKPRVEVRETVDQMLALVQMSHLSDRQTSQISGGQQQRVALARALAPHPKVLLLDEPLSALDLKLRKEMQIELKRLQNETGITFIFVTHDQEEALTMSDRLAVMSEGHILQVGSPRDIYEHPAERFVADFIGETNFLIGEMTGRNGSIASVTLKSGKSVEASLPSTGPEMAGGQVSLVIRPEHARLTDPGDALLTGMLENVVYFGTDTHFHVAVNGGDPFIVRQQNARTGTEEVPTGTEVGIAFDEGAVQVLRD
ncbi:MAG: ABC transporter ATP-binding protein [Pseudomonadota bacterium]